MRAFALSILVLLSACGGVPLELPGTDGGVPGDGPGAGLADGGFLTEAQRLEVIAAVMAARPPTLTADAHATALLAALRASPLIEAAGVSGRGGVWARFVDGTLYADFIDRDLDFDAVQTTQVRRLDLPLTTQAVTMNSLEPWWTDASTTVGQWLGFEGYPTRSHLGGSVDDLLGFHDVAVLFWQTHSSPMDTREPLLDAAGQPVLDPKTQQPRRKEVFAYLTSTLASPTPSPENLARLHANQLIIATVSRVRKGGPSDPFDVHYAATDRFITTLRGAFAPDSLVALDSCYGITAAAAWQAAGAGAVVSWDDESGSGAHETFALLFDRLLGQNALSPVSSPEERPFSLGEVRDWLVRTGRDLDPGVNGAAHLKVVGDALLRPTLANMLFEAPNTGEPYEKLLLQGHFGSERAADRRVTWGGQPLTIVRWTEDLVTVRVPPAPYPAGDVVVWVGERRAQSAPLSSWVLPMTVEYRGEGSLLATMDLRLVLRADVRSFRDGPERPLHLSVPMNVLTLTDSSGTLTASGEWRNANGSLVEAWSGGGALEAVDPGTATRPTKNFVFAGGMIWPTTSDAQLTLSAEGDYTVTGSGGVSHVEMLRGGYPLLFKRVQLDWPSRAIVGGSASYPFGARTLTVTWPTVMPTDAPEDTDPR